jgi:hypothetical protein
MHQEDHGFVTARVSNPQVDYRERIWDMEIADFVSKTRGSWRGMAARLVVLDLEAGLASGDTIELRWGAAGGGYGAGTKVTTVVPRPGYRAQVHVRYFENPRSALPDFGRSFAGYERPSPDEELALCFEIAPRVPHRLRLLRKTEGALLVPHDVFWNVPDVADLETMVDGPVPDRKTPYGTFEYRNSAVQLQSRDLPMTATPAMDNVYQGYNLYWGDIHTHSAYSIDCVEREKMDMGPGDLMAAARQRAGLDFFAVSDHHQPWDIPRHHLGREAWEATLDAAATHHTPGAFVVFPAIEFRCVRGDTVVLFAGAPGYDVISGPELVDVRALWARLASLDIVTVPHFHNPGKLPDGEWWSPQGLSDSETEPVLEIFSCHGSYERQDALEHHIPLIKASRPDRYGAHFLKTGYRYGFVCNSDGHKGHVGTNGLTAVYAKSLTRDSIFEAYRQRHVYGTTNARIRLLFTGNGHLMGDVIPDATEKLLTIDVTGESALKKVELYRNGDLYQRFVPAGLRFQKIVDVSEAGPSSWYVRATQLDNHIAYSSPIWFARDAPAGAGSARDRCA